jgi:hypothetical protein
MKKLFLMSLLLLSGNALATVDKMCFDQCVRQGGDGYRCENQCTFYFSTEQQAQPTPDYFIN